MDGPPAPMFESETILKLRMNACRTAARASGSVSGSVDGQISNGIKIVEPSGSASMAS